MTQVALSALRSVEKAGSLVEGFQTAIDIAQRITFRGHVIGGLIIGVAPLVVQYAYAHPAVGAAGAALLFTKTVRGALHWAAGVSIAPKA